MNNAHKLGASEEGKRDAIESAAPDLLHALKRLLCAVGDGYAASHDDGCRCVIHEAKAAIAKAEGR